MELYEDYLTAAGDTHSVDPNNTSNTAVLNVEVGEEDEIEKIVRSAKSNGM